MTPDDDPEWKYGFPHEPTLEQIFYGGCLIAMVCAVAGFLLTALYAALR